MQFSIGNIETLRFIYILDVIILIFSQDRLIKKNKISKFNLVLKRNHKEFLIFKIVHMSLKDFRLLFGAKKSSSLYWAKNPHVKISVTQAVLVIQVFFLSLKISYKVAHLLLKRTKSWITSVHPGKKKNEKFHNVNRNEIFHSIYIFHLRQSTLKI